MNHGAVIFAMGDSIDYVSMAAWNAKRINRYLDLPVTLITDSDVLESGFDSVINVTDNHLASQRYFADIGARVSWHNHNRCDALDLSPYDRTLLLDADYVVSGDALRTIMQHGSEFQCFRTAYDVTTGRDLDDLNEFGMPRMPMWWATVVAFTKGRFSSQVFAAWRMIRDHWQHYRDIYHITDPLFRNDIALSIALGISTGHTFRVHDIPWRLATLIPSADITLGSDDTAEFIISYTDLQHRRRWQPLPLSQDCHVMAKSHLGKILENFA